MKTGRWILGLLFATAAGASQAELALKGYTPGTAMADCPKGTGKRTHLKFGLTTCMLPATTIEKQPIRQGMLWIFDGKLASASYDLVTPGLSLRQLRKALVEKFGQPTVENPRNEAAVWRDGASEVEIDVQTLTLSVFDRLARGKIVAAEKAWSRASAAAPGTRPANAGAGPSPVAQ